MTVRGEDNLPFGMIAERQRLLAIGTRDFRDDEIPRTGDLVFEISGGLRRGWGHAEACGKQGK